MKTKPLLLAIIFCVLSAVPAVADEAFLEEFRDNYTLVDLDLMNNVGEAADIKDFIYEKDVAVFTFEEGSIYLLRYINGRPTTAIFIGKGHARIDVPSNLESNALEWCSGKKAVDEDFEVCFIRMADDFDLKLKGKFAFEQKELTWKPFNIAKKAQGEFFFKPNRNHEYDNYFQLLRSVYERREDSYFWCDFNRYTFNFDPNRPEQVVIGYEHEGGDMVITEAAVFQRKENNVYDDRAMSNLDYPTTLLSREAEIVMGGMDGRRIDHAVTDISLMVNADSLRFVSLFLHYNLQCDSIYFENQPVDCWRRKDFNFIGLILPEYKYKNDTLSFRFWYNGKDYTTLLPFVENPQPTPYRLTFKTPNGYNYLMTGMSGYTPTADNMQEFTVTPAQPFNNFYFQPYASGFDTVPVVTNIGLTMNFINSKEINKNRFECYIPFEDFQKTTLNAFNFMCARLGVPPGTFEVFVFPEDTTRYRLSMPGLMEVPQVFCNADGTGGLYTEAGFQAGRQWFGATMQIKSYRERWLTEATGAYLALSLVENTYPQGNEFYNELHSLKSRLLIDIDRDDDIPLGAVRLFNEQTRINKGTWVWHMLRYLMHDLETHSDQTFWKLLQEFSLLSNSRVFTNDDFIKLAEKYYGQPLGWFFDKWLYDHDIPEYDVTYAIVQEADGYHVKAQVTTKNTSASYDMPIIMRVEGVNGENSFHRVVVNGEGGSFAIGPLAAKPAALHFNEFYSSLSKDKVKTQ
ncbi:MAG: hypothetical protein ACOYVF_10185 [Candidatus Zixiibacteriota bacterium]